MSLNYEKLETLTAEKLIDLFDQITKQCAANHPNIPNVLTKLKNLTPSEINDGNYYAKLLNFCITSPPQPNELTERMVRALFNDDTIHNSNVDDIIKSIQSWLYHKLSSLHQAVLNNDTETVPLLMDNGHDANQVDSFGLETTPLSLSLNLQNNNCFSLMLNHPKFTATQNIKFAILAAAASNNTNHVSALIDTAKKYELLKKFPDLLDQAIEIKSMNSALDCAIAAENPALEALLVDAGAKSKKMSVGNEATPEKLPEPITWNDDTLTIKRPIGAGNYGGVYEALWDSRTVAVKLFNKTNKNSFTQEAQIYNKLINPSVIQAYRGMESTQHYCIIMAYAEKGSLKSLIKEKKVSPQNAKQWLLHIAAGIKYLHKTEIIHCDFKLDNIVIDNSDQAKICDFGLAMTLSEAKQYSSTNVKGALQYLPPEGMMPGKKTISFKKDIYSFAILAWELDALTLSWYLLPLTSQFAMNSYCSAVILGMRPPIEKISAPALAGLFQRCWAHKPEDRPNANEVYQTLTML